MNAEHDISYSGSIAGQVNGNGAAVATAQANFNERIGEYVDVLNVNWADVVGQDLIHAVPDPDALTDAGDFAIPLNTVNHSSVMGGEGAWVQGFKTHMEVDSSALVDKDQNEDASAHSGDNVMSDTALYLVP